MKLNKPLLHPSTISSFKVYSQISAEIFFLDFNPHLYSVVFTVNTSPAWPCLAFSKFLEISSVNEIGLYLERFESDHSCDIALIVESLEGY